jgi:hypothetical protein
MKTSLYSILCITIRLGAVIWIVGSLVNLPFSWIGAMNTPHPTAAIGWLLGEVACQIVIAFLFWLYPGVLARLAAGRATHEFFESSTPPAMLQYVALSVVGVWFLLQGLVYLSFEVSQAAQFAFESLPSRFPAMAASSMRVIAGLVLLFGARGLVGVLHALRGQVHASTAGKEPNE